VIVVREDVDCCCVCGNTQGGLVHTHLKAGNADAVYRTVVQCSLMLLGKRL